MSAMAGGCMGPGTSSMFCVCDCHIDSERCSDPRTCGPRGTDGLAVNPQRASVQDHVRVRHPNRTKAKPTRSRKVQRRAAKRS